MSRWVNLKLINGWVADKNNPPRYKVMPNGLVEVEGAAIATKDPELPVARIPRQIRPPFEVGDEELRGHTVRGWKVHPNGYLFLWEHHILEGL